MQIKINESNQHVLACDTWGQEELNAIQEVIRSGRFTMGPQVKKFEIEFAKKVGSKYAIMVSSGSMANLVATSAFFYKKQNPLKAGDEVIVPAISWATTYYPLFQHGLKLKFVDVDLNTLNLDVTKLEKAITPKTKMVVGVSILGNPAKLDSMREFCNRKDLYLFEDNCESMGAILEGKQCGTFGDIGTFSTFFSHHISTMEGGLIVTDDEELYQLCVCLRAHGWTRDLPSNTTLYEKKSEDFFEAYRFILPGYNARPIEMSGAIGIEQLKKLDKMLDVRRKNAEVFKKLFQNDDRFIIQKENGSSSWFSFTIILNPKFKIDRKKVLETLKENRIEFRIITGGNFLRHDVIKHIPHEVVDNVNNANIAHDLGFFVGNYPFDATKQIENLFRILDQAVGRVN